MAASEMVHIDMPRSTCTQDGEQLDMPDELQREPFADLKDFSAVVRWQMTNFKNSLRAQPKVSDTFKRRAARALDAFMKAADTCQHELVTAAASIQSVQAFEPRTGKHSHLRLESEDDPALQVISSTTCNPSDQHLVKQGVRALQQQQAAQKKAQDATVRAKNGLSSNGDKRRMIVSLDDLSDHDDEPVENERLRVRRPSLGSNNSQYQSDSGASLGSNGLTASECSDTMLGSPPPEAGSEPFSPTRSDNPWNTGRRRSRVSGSGSGGTGGSQSGSAGSGSAGSGNQGGVDINGRALEFSVQRSDAHVTEIRSQGRNVSLAESCLTPKGGSEATSPMGPVSSTFTELDEEYTMDRCIDLADGEDNEDPVGWAIGGVLNPNFMGRLAWDLNTMLLVMGDVMILPFQMAYGHGAEPGEFDVVWLWTTTSFFSCDIIASHFTAYTAGERDVGEELGKLVTKKRKILRNYYRTWFSIDLVSTVPWGVMASLLLGGESGSAGQLGKLTKVIKFVRFMRLMRMLRLAKLAVIWERVEAKCGSVFLLQGVALLRVLFVLIFICHWNACIWWIVGSPTNIVVELMSEDAQLEWAAIPHWTTIQRSNGPGEPTWTWGEKGVTEVYFFCFYWTLGVMRTMPAEVIPVTQPERVYIMIFMFFAFSAFAICVAQITQTFFKFSDRKRLFSDDMASVRMYLRKLNVSDQLQMKIKMFIRHLYDTRGINAREQFLLGLLPDHHKRELAHVKKAAYLMKLPLFSTVSFRSLQLVTEITESRDLVPGDVLCWKGAPAEVAWVPIVGRVRAKADIGDDPFELARNKNESIDIETLTEPETYRSKFTVVCITGCTCLIIDKAKFLERTFDNGSFWSPHGTLNANSWGHNNRRAEPMGRRRSTVSCAPSRNADAEQATEFDRQQAQQESMRQTAAVVSS